MTSPTQNRQPARRRTDMPKPWPMKWIVVIIIVFVIGYTVVNFWFRKPGGGYRPYQDAQDRATTARLLSAGWQKVPLVVRRPVEKPNSTETPAAVTRAAVGLGLDLDGKFAEPPQLLASIDRVVAPASTPQGSDYTLYFTASLADRKAQMGELTLFRQGNQLVIIPTTEPLPGSSLMSRLNDSNYTVSFSTGALAPGRYSARIVARGPAAAWSFNVR